MAHHQRAGSRPAATACLTTALGLTLALGTVVPAEAVETPSAPSAKSRSTQSPAEVISPELQEAQGQVAVFVQLQGPGAFETTQPDAVLEGDQEPIPAVDRVQAIHQSVDSASSSLASESDADLLYTTANALRGAALHGDAEQLRQLAERPDVAKISRIIPQHRRNAGSVVDTNALGTWTQTKHTGRGVKIAVIDTGIDYTHADFGGPGTVEAYQQAAASAQMPAESSELYDPQKIVGGYDLAGDGYDARFPQALPQPDGNPLDCEAAGHGTHVAGTAAGYGVTQEGETFRGGYSELDADEVRQMTIGPGTAPEAQLIALRVFGCEGSTNLVLDALDRSLDPNMDGDFSDKADVINLSLGSDFGPAEDPQNDMIDALSQQGILSIIAAGNAGDAHEVSGSPGSARSALTVANSQGSTVAQDEAGGSISADQINDSTSRGQHGSNGVIKPDVAAPGTLISSAGVAQGSSPIVLTGTSMAAPHVAGIAALVRQKHQDYTPQNIKAAIMNSAVHDVHAANGAVSAADRVGSGRVDALRAVNQEVLVYDQTTPSLVSSTFGVTEIGEGKQTVARKLVVDNTGDQAHTYQVRFEASTEMPGVEITAPDSVTVPAGGKSTLTVTATADRSALEKTRDPSEAVEQLGLARQFLATESGRLILTENGQDLRVPLSIAPKPTSDMRAETAAISQWNDQGESTVPLTGTGLNHGGWASALGAFELGAASDRIDSASLTGGNSQFTDLQYVGASSNIPQLLAEGGDVAQEGMIAIGISAWGNASTITPEITVGVDLDTTGDGQPDYRASLTREEGLDYPLVSLSRYVGGSLEVLDLQPLNGSFGGVDTNTFDTNVMVLPLKAAELGIDPTRAETAISYQVFTQSAHSKGEVDRSAPAEYRPVAPAISFRGQRFNDALFTDQPGQKLIAHRGSDSAEGRALFLHLHNATGDLSGIRPGEDGGRAEVKSFMPAA